MTEVPENIWMKGRRQERSLEMCIVKEVEYHTKEFGFEFHVVNGESPKFLIREMIIPHLVF